MIRREQPLVGLTETTASPQWEPDCTLTQYGEPHGNLETQAAGMCRRLLVRRQGRAVKESGEFTPEQLEEYDVWATLLPEEY